MSTDIRPCQAPHTVHLVTRPGHGGDSEAELVWPESACGSLFHVAPGAGAGLAMPRVTCAPLTLLLAGPEPPGAVGRARGADETRGDGDEGAGGEHAQHAAQQHRHPLHRLLLHHLHQHMYIYSTVYLVVLQKVPSEANPKVCNHGEGPY